MKIDLNDLVSQREAAELRGVTLQAINFLVKRGRFTTIEVSGKTFLLRKEVENYEPDTGGRPSVIRDKAKIAKKAKKAKRKSRKLSNQRS